MFKRTLRIFIQLSVQSFLQFFIQLCVQSLFLTCFFSLAEPFEKLTLCEIDFVFIPAGQFVMGTSSAAEAELRQLDWWNRFLKTEQPAHQVIIDQPFLMSKTEVTQRQWKSVMGKSLKWAFEGDLHPAESFALREVHDFVNKLNQKNVGNFRLPTEAEWEYAARAGSWGIFSIGHEGRQIALSDLEDHAWFKSNSNGSTQAVGQKKPNAWGLHDMLGNVWEWCSDYYDRQTYLSRIPNMRNPSNQTPFPERVIRGGSWFLPVEYQRPAFRSGASEDQRSPYIGFRLVCDLPKNEQKNLEKDVKKSER